MLRDVPTRLIGWRGAISGHVSGFAAIPAVDGGGGVDSRRSIGADAGDVTVVPDRRAEGELVRGLWVVQAGDVSVDGAVELTELVVVVLLM